MLLGVVADDITGATDLCLMLSREGMQTVQVIGLPSEAEPLPEAEAVVIALKSRTIPAPEAVSMSLEAARSLRRAGARQLMFKYCSTFDSTDEGNIGPVAEALLREVGSDLTIACPSFPANGRTTYKGYLFVGEQMLSDSPMKDHPLTPMRDSNLQRLLQRQTTLPVGLVDIATIRKGMAAIEQAFVERRTVGKRILIVDTLDDEDLRLLGRACKGMPLVTGGSGIGMGIAAHLREEGLFVAGAAATTMPAPPGRSVVLAGSCSVATLGQIAAAEAAGLPSLALDAIALAEGRQTVEQIVSWAAEQVEAATPLIYSSADPQTLSVVQQLMGQKASGEMIEQTLAAAAYGLHQRGFCRFIVAGGETSGAVVSALGVTMLEIGPEIDPGVPWTRSLNGPDLALALKSGNFGTPDFFLKAWPLLRPAAEHHLV